MLDATDISKAYSKVKAIILAAGTGSRMGGLTSRTPKSLLKIGKYTILEMMLSHIQSCGISEIAIVLGHQQNQIKYYIMHVFPHLDVSFIVNDKYLETNTAYSLLLTKAFVDNSAFIKFDADVVFERRILKNLLLSPHENCLCIDQDISLDQEEVKVILNNNGLVCQVSKMIAPADALGESIGIEKFGAKAANDLFDELTLMMQEKAHYQNYYEAAYENLIHQGTPLHALALNGLTWIEIDTPEDFIQALRLFSGKYIYSA